MQRKPAASPMMKATPPRCPPCSLKFVCACSSLYLIWKQQVMYAAARPAYNCFRSFPTSNYPRSSASHFLATRSERSNHRSVSKVKTWGSFWGYSEVLMVGSSPQITKSLHAAYRVGVVNASLSSGGRSEGGPLKVPWGLLKVQIKIANLGFRLTTNPDTKNRKISSNVFPHKHG